MKTVIGQSYALDRHARGWGRVTVLSMDGTLAICRDESDGNEYPVDPKHLLPLSRLDEKPKPKPGPYRSR